MSGTDRPAPREGPGRKPAWLKVRPPAPGPFRATGALLHELELHSVCEEARCPNKSECFSCGTATFLILGDRCTRDCRFCGVESSAADEPVAPGRADGASLGFAGLDVDGDEPRRVAEAALRLCLRHVVVTSVTRDDLPDGGAAHFAATVAALRAALPAATVEVLVPDFAGDADALRVVLAARPDVFGHNLETVPRLYPLVRPQADYGRSLLVLERAADRARGRHLRLAAEVRPGEAPHPADAARPAGTAHPAGAARVSSSTGRARRPLVKTGLMLGLGETTAEVERLLGDCVATGVDVVTVGQYLQPARDRLPVVRYVEPQEFSSLARRGRALGLEVVAAPFVRSSYRAGDVFAAGGDVDAGRRGEGRRP